MCASTSSLQFPTVPYRMTSVSNTMTSFLNTDGIDYGGIINTLINHINSLPLGSESKLIAFNDLINFVNTNALEYLLLNNSIKDNVVETCISIGYEYLSNSNDDIYYSDLLSDLVSSCTELLKLLCPKPAISLQEAKEAVEKSAITVQEARAALQEARAAEEQARAALQEARAAEEQAKVAAERAKAAAEQVKAELEAAEAAWAASRG